MTAKYLKQICRELGLYSTPGLNDILYLHFKGKTTSHLPSWYQGFAKIENMEAYDGLKSLWLEGNGIEVIEGLGTISRLEQTLINGLDALTQLKCL